MKKLLPDELPGIDIDSALNRLGDDEELLADLIITFREDNLTTVDNIRNALQKEEHDLVARLVHTLKGVAGNIGAEGLYGITRNLEIAVKEHDEPRVHTLLQTVEAEMDAVFSAAELLETGLRDESFAISETPPDPANLTPIFCELRDMLQTNNLKALQVYEQLEKQLADSSSEVAPLNRCLIKLDFRGALEQLYLLAGKYCIRI